MSNIPGVTSLVSAVIGAELAAESFDISGGQYIVKFDPASTVTIAASSAGINLSVPAPVPVTHTASFDALTNKLTTVVSGITVVTDLGSLDDEGVTMAFSAGNLVLKDRAGTVLSTTPIPDLDAQTLTKAAAATGITIAISGGNSIVITPADLNTLGVQTTATTVSNTVAGAGATRTISTTVNGVVGASVAIPDLDAQTLAIGGTVAAPTLAISNGNTVNLPTLAGLSSAAVVAPPNAAGATPTGYVGADGLVHLFSLVKSSLGTPMFWVVPA